MQTTESLVKIALKLVLDGAQLTHLGSFFGPVEHKESLRDIVTSTDLAISQVIVSGLSETGIPVVTEEDAASLGYLEEKRIWVVDPIDGTVNYAHQLSNFAVSIGLMDAGQFSLGFVCAPGLNELYFTLTENRALFNGQVIRSAHLGVQRSESLFAASFGAGASDSEYLFFKHMNESGRGCLRTGAASLNVCWVAVGRIQVAYGFRAKLWDVAGALSIARAAGCHIALRKSEDPRLVDYCVGPKELVDEVVAEAASYGLWGAL